MSYPIFNSGKYAMKYRYQYLADLMDTGKSIIHFRPLLKERCEHRHLQLETTLVDWEKIIENMQAGIENDSNNDIDDLTQSLNKSMGEKANANNPEVYKEENNKKPVTRQKKVLTLKAQLSAEEFDRLTRRFTKTIRMYEKDGNNVDRLTLYKLKQYLKLRVRNNDITEEQKNKSINYVKQLIEEAKAK